MNPKRRSNSAKKQPPYKRGLISVPPSSPRNKREQIVKAATKVFLTHGYAGTSMSKVAEAASVIKATIYSHFKTKRMLFKGIMEQLTVQACFERFEADSEGMNLSEFIDFMGDKISARNKDPQFRDLIRVIIGDSGRFPDVARLFYETVSAQGNSMVAEFIAHCPELKIPDPKATAQVLTGSMVYWMLSQEILGGKHIAPISSRRIIEALKFLFAQCTST